MAGNEMSSPKQPDDHPRRLALLVTSALCVTALCLPIDAALGDKLTPAERQTAQEALSEFNELIGGWRGVGQPRRGSNRGAWREDAEWVWDFQPESVGVRYEVKDGKLVESARVTWDADARQYELTLTTPDDEERTYRGKRDGKQIVLESPADAEGTTHRLTITKLNDKRTLILHETQAAGQSTFFRVAEVGYTREGTRLAVPGGGQPECIVTGGTGTMKVTHNGKTYYVCCTGCRQAFEDDPEGIIAEAAERRRKEAAEQK